MVNFFSPKEGFQVRVLASPPRMEKLKFIKPKLVTPKFFLGIPLAVFSLEVYFGAIFGYFLFEFLSGEKTGLPGKIKSAAFNIGNRKVHLHHWLYGLGILIPAIWYQFLPFPQFSYGFLGGMIFQGISCYHDWHRVLIRNKQ